jgi:hypothetical protein
MNLQLTTQQVQCRTLARDCAQAQLASGRDVLGLQIGDGTAQIMKLIIVRQPVGKALAP